MRREGFTQAQIERRLSVSHYHVKRACVGISRGTFRPIAPDAAFVERCPLCGRLVQIPCRACEADQYRKKRMFPLRNLSDGCSGGTIATPDQGR